MVMTRDGGALQRAERRLSVLVEKTHDVITVLSRSGTIEYQSPSCQRLTGFTAAELLGRNVFELAHPDDVADLRTRFAVHLRNPDRPMDAAAQARMGHKAGGWSWVEIVATGVHRFDTRCWALIGIDAATSSVPLEQLKRMTRPDDLARSRGEMQRHIKGETPWYEIEYRAKLGGDRWHWVHARGRTSARAAEGRVTRISGVMMSINERRRAEIELRDSQHRLEAALWGGGVGVWNWDTATERSEVSDSWLAIGGFSRDEWTALRLVWRERLHPDDRERALGVFGTSVDITAQKKTSELLEATQAAASIGGWELNLRTQGLAWTAATYAIFETTLEQYSPTVAGAFELYVPCCHAAMGRPRGSTARSRTSRCSRKPSRRVARQSPSNARSPTTRPTG